MPRAGLDAEIITEAAAVIVGAHGPAALTPARLAAEFGVAPPSLYKHVAGLEDLILRVTTLSLRRLADKLSGAAIGRSGRQALVAIAESYRSFALEHTGLYSLTHSAPNPGSTTQQAEARRIVDILRASISSYRISDRLEIHAIRLVRAGLHGFADIEARGGFQLPHSIDDSFLVLVDALHASLTSLGQARHGGVTFPETSAARL